MSGPISPDGTQIWNGVSWVPLNQNQIYQQSSNFNTNNIPQIVTIQTKSNNLFFFGLVVIFLFLLVLLLSGFVSKLGLDDREKIPVTVSEFVVVEGNINDNWETSIICYESNTVISPNSHIACELDIIGMSEIDLSFFLNSGDHTVNLLTMTEEEYQKFTDGLKYEYISSLSALDVSAKELSGWLDNGNYVTLIHNY